MKYIRLNMKFSLYLVAIFFKYLILTNYIIMKKLYFLLLTILISSASFAQVLAEDFDYGMTGGDLTAVSGGA